MGKTRIAPEYSYSRKDMVAALAVGAFAAWNGLAFRIADAPEVTFPWSFLSFPRHDEAWLFALLMIMTVSSTGCLIRHVFHLKRESKRVRRLALVFSGVAMTVATGGLVGIHTSLAVTLFCGAICGAGMAVLLYEWVPYVEVDNIAQLLYRIMMGFVLAFAVDALVGVLPQMFALLLVSLLPSVTSICLLANVDNRPTAECSEPFRHSFANTLTACVAMFGFAVFMGIIGFDYDFVTEQNVQVAQACLMAGGAVIATGVLLVVKRFFNVERLQVVVPIVLTTSFVLLPLSSAYYVREIAAVLAQSTLLLTFVVVVLAMEEGRRRNPRCRFLFLMAVLSALNLFGVIVGGVIRNVFGLDVTALTFTALLVIYFVLLIALPLSRYSKSVKHVIQGAAVVGPAEAAQIRCGALASRYPSLSLREKDVLFLMIQNYSNQRMAETLIVSESTVKTHVRHIYAKMGIRSRQELLAEADTISLESDTKEYGNHTVEKNENIHV